MIFNSLIFVPFFAVVLAVHYSPLSWRVRKLSLLVASYLFYAAWNPAFATLLVVSTLVDWCVARWIWRSKGARRRAILIISLVVNLGLVVFFKYGNFFLRSAAWTAQQFGVDWSPPALDVLLPVGISFYTFATLSYTIDVYRGELEPRFKLIDFALFVAFFPHMVAGPILRASDLLVQFERPCQATSAQFGWGLALLTMGIFLKVSVADGCFADVANQVYATSMVASPTTHDAWLGTLAFSGQIYCDFAGYSLCAIGIALTLGVHLVNNFHFPYAAIGFSDFWRRWHISLSTWLRDYVYIPLGGNRVSRVRTYINLMATMLLGGLWHGASWTFVVWGGLHGLYLVGERGIRHVTRDWTLPRRGVATVAWACTYLLTCLAWVFFRAGDFDSAWRVFRALGGDGAGAPNLVTSANSAIILLAIGLLLSTQILFRNISLEELWRRWTWPTHALALGAMMIAIAIGGGGYGRAFIYFQF